jgi:diaminopimelate decarboxylase
MAGKRAYERPIIVKQHAGVMNKIGSRAYLAPVHEIDGQSVRELAARFGSPLFVLSERVMRQNQRRALRAFSTRYPRVQFAWSYKTNYLSAVCQVFHQEGSWAEVVSDSEYDRARRLGVPGNMILFNGPHKSVPALTRAIREHARIHLDGFDELGTVSELADSLGATAFVALRINLDAGIVPKWDRFGFNLENGDAWRAAAQIMQTPRLKLAGLHTHIGTYIMSVDPYRAAALKLSEFATQLREHCGHSVDYLDLGGGFASQNTLLGQYLPAEGAVPSIDQYADAICSALQSRTTTPADLPVLYLESGRVLVDNAGYLITTVLASKRLADERRATVIDAGVNILFTSFWYKHRVSPAQEHGDFTEETALYGPLCMNIDCIREQVTLPPLKAGDQLVIHDVGAYNMTQWMQFIAMRPNVVMIMESGEVELIREAEQLDDLMRLEHLPAQLSSPTR